MCDDAATYDDPWDDVHAGNTHYRNILCLVAAGVAEGYGDGTYGPADAVTRGQMATFIANMIERERPLSEGEHRFDDVDRDSPHDDSIHALAHAGVVEGLETDRFGPDQPGRRDQMATFLQRAIDYAHQGAVDGSAPPAADQEPYFQDLAAGATHADAIDALTEQAVLAGYGDGTYGPADTVRRDQMASFILRSVDYLEEVLDEDAPTDGASLTVEPACAMLGDGFTTTAANLQPGSSYSVLIDPVPSAGMEAGTTGEADADGVLEVPASLQQDAQLGDYVLILESAQGEELARTDLAIAEDQDACPS